MAVLIFFNGVKGISYTNNISPYTLLNKNNMTYVNTALDNKQTERESTYAFSNRKIGSYNIFGVNQKDIANIQMVRRDKNATKLFIFIIFL